MSYKEGYLMGASSKKIPKKKAKGILNLAQWRNLELLILDEEIAQLKAKRDKIYRTYNNAKLADKYNVHPLTVSRIEKGECWKELSRRNI